MTRWISLLLLGAWLAVAPVSAQEPAHPDPDLAAWGPLAFHPGHTWRFYLVEDGKYRYSGSETCDWVTRGAEFQCTTTQADGSKEPPVTITLGEDGKFIGRRPGDDRQLSLTVLPGDVIATSFTRTDGALQESTTRYEDATRYVETISVGDYRRIGVGVRDDHPVMKDRPGDGSIPALAVGQEAVGTLGHGTSTFRGNVPVGMYRFEGRRGQRVCARVDSPDATMHVYLSRSPESAPFASSWITSHDLKNYRGGNSRSLMFTLPESGAYYVYAMAHVPSGMDMYDKHRNNFYFDKPASSGSYELKLWDADRPEPPSTLPTLAKGDEVDTGHRPWLGALARLLDTPFVDSANSHVSVIGLSGDTLIQVSRDPVSGREYQARFESTGRRGEFVDEATGRVLQAACGGTWTVADGRSVRHYWMSPAYTQLATYQTVPRAAPHAVPAGGFGADGNVFSGTLNTADAATIAMILENLQMEREIAAENAQNRARYEAEDRANQQAMAAGILGGFAGGLSEEAADQQYAQDEFEYAVREGQRQGLAERAARLAEEGAQVAGTSGASVGASSEADDSLPPNQGSSAAEADGSVAPATVLLAKGFQATITPGATSNEMCFARVQVGPVTTGDGREGEAKRAAADSEQRFLAACREIGEVTAGDFADEWYVDERAESTYARLQANRWMHEVDVD